MNPTERIIRTLEGKPVDRVPTFCAGLEDRTFNEVLGQPPFRPHRLIDNPVSDFLFRKWSPLMTKMFFQPLVTMGMEKRVKAAAKLGFDADWAIYEETFTPQNSKSMVRYSGSIYDIIDDGYGNSTYMYRGPGITSPKAFQEWPYWREPDEIAHRSYTFFKKIMKRYGENMCICGQGAAYGIQETILWSVGFERMPIWIMREKELIRRFIDMLEEICMKTSMALMDAGVAVILQTDDFAFKSGPMINPKQIDTLFGPSYTRIIKAVHDRGGKYILHSCGDNTLLFERFIKWGVDGLHAYENTSNVDIFKEKEIHGKDVTIIGGVGIDYLLSERSTDEEIVEEVKKLIKALGPGGRFMIAPVHSMSSVPADKLQVMLDAAREYGKYPITV
ncbi:MAG: uroporphyrinogen decarboxylase family protein [Desulfobacterales bacterium]